MNLPNSLTVLRIILIPFFVGFLIYGHYGSALLALIVAGITDILDGVIARMANQRTATTLTVLSIIIVGTLLLYVTETPLEVVPTVLGKGATLSQLLYLGLALVFIYLQRDRALLIPLLAIMLVLTVVSGLQYVYRGIRAYHPDLV